MRTAFIQELCRLAEENEDLWLVCGDLGYSVLEQFADRFPKRYLNAGVAEQNMVGLAAGLALSGKTVFTYSIANFPIARCMEQVRNDVCYHNLNVKVVAVGGGLAYGSHGYTHHAVEDIALMSAMPNMMVAAPADPVEARGVTRIVATSQGPAYLRLGKAGEPVLNDSSLIVEKGKSVLHSQGSELTIITTGGMLGNALAASKEISRTGRTVRLLSMPFLRPLDEDAIASAAIETGAILTVEEHGPGGLGTSVAEVLAALGRPVAFKPLRLSRQPIKTAGSQEQLCRNAGLSAEGIVKSANELFQHPSYMGVKSCQAR